MFKTKREARNINSSRLSLGALRAFVLNINYLCMVIKVLTHVNTILSIQSNIYSAKGTRA